MTSVWLFQLTISISVILSIALVVHRLLEISFSKSFLISISLIILISMLLETFGLYKFSINILIIISIIPLFFSKIRETILEQKLLIIEFISLLLILFFFSYDRILMDEDELYFWAVKYKYFVMHLSDINNYDISLIEEPYKIANYGNSTALFQSFVTSFIGYDEGGAIFANNIIIISLFYFLFGSKVTVITQRIIYLLILYLILNNLSFGFLSIYTDPIVAMFYAAIVYYLYSDFNYKNLKNLTLLTILIVVFFEIHRISILMISCLLIIFLINNFKNKKDLTRLFLWSGLFITFFYFLINFSTTYDLNFSFLSQLNLHESISLFINIFLSRSYNSQFGVSYNEILNYLKIDFLNLPEYIWHNFIWYFACLIIAYINGKKIIKLNIFFLLIFFIFSVAIIINKIYLNNTSPQVFGRYISFIIIPCILINLIYYTPIAKYKYVSLFIIVGILATSTPKKAFGFFFPKDIYSKYDQWNENYYIIRKTHNELFNKIRNTYKDELYNAIVVFKDQDIIYDDHPSLYQSAMKADFYPVNLTIVTFNQFINNMLYNDHPSKEFNIGHYFSNKDVLIYYNLDSHQKKVVKKFTKKYKIKYYYNLILKD